nr:DUF4381 domain-containing protein [Marinobacter bryozoorum]
MAQLHDIETPPPAGPWPPAPGWWLLGGLVLALLVSGTFMLWRRYQRTAPRREALAQLAAHGAPDRAGPDWYAALNRLLKQTALALYPEQNPVALSGDQWRDFLARTSDVPRDSWQQLVNASYAPASDLAPDQAHKLAEHWIRRQPW